MRLQELWKKKRREKGGQLWNKVKRGFLSVSSKERKEKDRRDERAEQLFDELNMQETQDCNGVLIYLAFKPHHLAVIGDQGIDEKVGKDFWQAVYEAMKKQLQLGNYTQAICDGIAQIEEQLARYFPYQANDVNELPNEVVIK